MILFASYLGDPVVERIAGFLDCQGVQYAYFDPLRILTNKKFVMSGPNAPLFLHETIDFNAVTALHYRKPSPLHWLPEGRTEITQAIAETELESYTRAVWAILRGIPWVGCPKGHGPDKLEQLRRAHDLGMVVPDYCFTNAQEVAEAFYDRHYGKIITKTLGRPKLSGVGIYTSRIESRDWLKNTDAAPLYLQEEIRKSYEIRATVVAEDIFAVRIDSQKYETTVTDWRLHQEDELSFEPYILPASIQDFCRTYLQSFGLYYGAFDFAVKQDGTFVFFECNVNGEYDWIECDTDYPISKSIAALLVKLSQG